MVYCLWEWQQHSDYRSHSQAVFTAANKFDVKSLWHTCCRSHLNKQETERNMFFIFVCEKISVSLHTLQVTSLTPHAHLFLWLAWTQACLPPMGLCIVKTEGPDSCGHRLEECLPSGQENVISWDQRIRGWFLFLPLRSHFPSNVLLAHAGTLTSSHSPSLESHRHTHMHTLSDGEKWHLFFQLFPLFLHTWAWGTRGNLVFSCDKTHRGLCGFGRGE